MPDFAPSVTRLIDELKRLPGIGQKTAQRLAFYLLRVDPEQAFALSDAIRDAKEKVRECSICNNITDADPCLFCTGPSRSKKIYLRGGRSDEHSSGGEDAADSTGCITCWAERFRLCKGLGPINSRSRV